MAIPPYNKSVKSRLTALLSLLLLASAVFGLPVTRGASLRFCAEIVCEQRERRTELVAAVRVAHDTPLPEAAVIEAPIAILLDHSLFQRPPPAA
jgi:hypothetical protein